MGVFGLSSRGFAGARAPEFPGKGPWLNSLPLTLADLREKVVLLDFWTYSCVNCLRALPHLKEWHRKYAGDGLVIIGVHSPEFEFEKRLENVERFVRREGIEYPVVLDGNLAIWNAYANRYWPRKYLIDGRGVIYYDHAGEGAYQETEHKIQGLLRELSPQLDLPEVAEEEPWPAGAVCYPTTPELYCGYDRGSLGNAEDYRPGMASGYADPGRHLDGNIYLQGPWRAEGEYVRFETTRGDGYLAMRYHALEVNAVMGAQDDPVEALVTRDGRPLGPDTAGSDVTLDSGRSLVGIAEHRMYNLVDDWEFAGHVLRIQPLGPGFEIYAFTFGGCREV